MENFLKELIYNSVIMLSIFIIFCFIMGNTNVFDWGESVRIGMVLCFVFSSSVRYIILSH